MRFGRTLVSFTGLTVMLLGGELWLIRLPAAQESRIAFSNLVFDNFEIYVMDADGGNRENLSNHPVDDMDPDWSPDGTKIAFVSNRHDGVNQIHVMDADGENQIKLTYGPREKRFPDWSPDGGKIAFTVLADWKNDWEDHIAVMDANGNNPERFENNARQPSWSPDGKMIAFVSMKPDRRGDICMKGFDGQGFEKLTRGVSPSFSPDGGRLAYYASHEGFHHVFVIGADGKNPMRLTHNQEHHFHPTWSPDGQMVAYAVSDDNVLGANIHLMTADGKYLKQLSKVRDGTDDQPDFSPVGLTVSPTAVSPASKTTTTWGKLKKFTSSFR